jgi:putative oxidoreductase
VTARSGEPKCSPVRTGVMKMSGSHLDAPLASIDGWLARHSITVLRWSLGAVFLVFGFLKFFPGVSPAEYVATETTSMLTFGLVGHGPALIGVALLESTIGLCLLSGRFLGVGLALLGIAFVGILSPLVLLADELFTGPSNAPNLLGQYVFKDVILVAAALVVVAMARGARLEPARLDPDKLPARRKMEIVLAGLRGDRPIAAVCEEHRISEELFFQWRDQLLDVAARTLAACETDRGAKRLLDQRLAAVARDSDPARSR